VRKPKRSQKPADFRSGYERQLRVFLLKNKIPFAYEAVKFALTLAVGNHRCKDCGSAKVERRVSYTPDWILTAKDIIVESKGKFTARDRKIALAMQEQYPLETYKLLFQRDNWISKTKTQRYSDWCRKHNIDFHIGTEFPKEWWA
jgi:hypothetical protein